MKRRAPSGRCVKCATWRASLHTDHIVPKWRGGVDELHNIQWLCANCHEDKTWFERKSPDYKAFQSTRMKARMLSPEARKNVALAVSSSNKYRHWLATSRDKCGWNRGMKLKPFSAEHRAKIGASKKGKPLSEAHRAALRAAHARRLHPEGTWPILVNG